nr:ATP synthase F0 subunit 8 [Iheyomytilidicola lauensis]UJV31454.1 ATP synthase F0 subunit 8 [Iheyomytilidicola lauensis]
MPQLSPLPWIFSILSLLIMIYIFKILIWYTTSSSLKFI